MGGDVQAQNVRRVLIDGIGVGIASAAAPYLPVFLTRLGADNFAIGLLTSMPALAGLIFAVPLGQFLARQRNIVPWYSLSRFLVVLCYTLTGLVPFFVTDYAVLMILLIWALATIPQTIVNVGFTVVMAGVAGPEGRFYLMSRRWSSLGITSAIVVAVAGIVLDRIVFPLNFQIVFIALSMGGLLSLYFSRRIELPPQPAPPQTAEPSRLARLYGWLRAMRQHPKFVETVSSQFIYRFGLAFAIPLFPLYYVRELNATDEQIGFIATVGGAVLLGAYFFWARVTKKRGIRFALLTTTAALAFYPIIMAFTQQIEIVIALAGLAGIFAAGIDLVLFDMVVSSYPQDQAATFVGIQQTTVYLATFIAPLVATTLATNIGIPQALIVAGAIRLVGFGAFVLFGRA
ncbi:MFS transporter [Anaerolineae bacterium CFX7]|nr:MFS transporter [Anaerolineae bacterium CFX7]